MRRKPGLVYFGNGISHLMNKFCSGHVLRSREELCFAFRTRCLRPETRVYFQFFSRFATRAFPRRTLFAGKKCSLMKIGFFSTNPSTDVFSRHLLAASRKQFRSLREANITVIFHLGLSFVGTQCIT